MKELSTILKSLGDETRLRMLGLLQAEGELCVCDVFEALQITQSRASRHLRHLVNAGFVQDRKEGIWVYFRIAETAGPVQAAVLSALADALAENLSDGDLHRLGRWRECKARDGVTCKVKR